MASPTSTPTALPVPIDPKDSRVINKTPMGMVVIPDTSGGSVLNITIDFYEPVAYSPRTLYFDAPGNTSLVGSLSIYATVTTAYKYYSFDGQIIYWGNKGDAALINKGTEYTPPATTSTVAIASTASTSDISLSKRTTLTTGSIAPSTISGETPAATTPSNSQKTTTPKTHGISSGSVAGIAIGCLLAGALIAGLLAWLCFRRRREKRFDGNGNATTMAFLPREKGIASKGLSAESESPVSQVAADGLPQPLEDQAITGDMSKLSILIKNHVQSFYHTGRVSPGLLDLEDLQSLGHNLPLSIGTLSTLIGNSNTREIALRFCVAWVLVSRMQPQGDLTTTFLPPEVARCYGPISPQGARPDQVFLAAKWRAMTAELLRSSYSSNVITNSDPRFPNIRAATDILDGILRPYMDSRMNNEERRRNLEEICKRAAVFAFTLFSQPSTWMFDWKDGGVKTGSLCVFPALVQIIDETGHRLTVPRPFSEAVVRELNG